MAYEYVLNDEILEISGILYNNGYRGDELSKVIGQAADNLEYERFSAQSAQGIIPTLFKSTVAATPRVVATTLRGITPYTPGKNVLDELLITAAEKTEEFIPELWEREAAEAAGGPKWGAGMGETWASMVGQQLPVIGAMRGGQKLGAGLGGAFHPIAGVAGGIAGGYASMATMESGGFLTATEDLGLDPDLQDKWARAYGAVSGGIEYLQTLGMIGPYMKGAKPASKAVSKGVLMPLLKTAGNELGVAALEGIEEVFQGATFNQMLDRAIAEQNERNRKEGIPELDPTEIEGLKQNLTEGFKSGFGIAMIIRTPGVITKGIKAKAGARLGAMVKAGEVEGQRVLQAVKDNEDFEEIFGEIPERPIVEPYYMPEAKKEARKTLTAEEWNKRIDKIPPQSGEIEFIDEREKRRKVHVRGVIASADAWGIDTENKSYTQLKQEIKDIVARTQGQQIEGPRLLVSLDDRISETSDIKKVLVRKPVKGVKPGTRYVEIITPSVNVAQETEIRREQKIERKLQSILSKMPTAFGTWMTKFETTAREGRIPKDLVKESVALGLTQEDVQDFETQIEQGKQGLDVAIPQGYTRFIDSTQARVLLNAAMYRSLSTVVGEDIADAVLPLNQTSLKQVSNLHEILARDQYTMFMDNLEGELRTLTSDVQSDEALRSLDVELENAYNLGPIPLFDGRTFDVTQLPEPAHFPWVSRQWRKWAALYPSLERLQGKSNLRLMGLDKSVFWGHKMEQKVRLGLRLAERLIWKQIPKALRTGLPGKHMAELVLWMATDAKQKAAQAKELSMPNNLKALKARVAEVSTFKDVDAIGKYAQQVVDERKVLFDWFARNGIIKPEQFRQQYVPVIRRFINDPTREGKPFGEWVHEHRRDVKGYGALAKLNDTEVEGLVELGDTLASTWRKKGYATPGKADPFFQYARTADEALLQDLGKLTDIRDIDDIYINAMVRKKIFGPMVPAIVAIVNQAVGKNGVFKGDDKAMANRIFANYFETIMGVPDTASRVLRDVNIASVTHGLVRQTNKFLDWYNKTPLFAKLPRVEVRETDGVLTAQEALNLGMTYMYATTLGLPFNVVSPLKNLTQSFLAIPAIGAETYFRGLHALKFDPSVYEELKGYDLRPEYPGAEFELGGRRGRYATAARVNLSLYRVSDLTNVYGTAAGGLVAWRRLQPHLDKSPTGEHLTAQQMIDMLFNQRDPKIDDIEVMKTDVPSDIGWKGVISKPVAMEVVDLIRRDKGEDAKKLYLQYLVNLSQWRYGAGGTPGLMRNSVAKAALMYWSWPVNYIDYMINAFGKKGVTNRAFQAMGLQFLVATVIMGGLGLPTWQWILFGPLPDDLKPTGPVVQFAERLLKIITGSGVALTASVMPGVPEKERKMAWKRVRRNIEDLVDEKFLDRRVLDFLD